MPITTTVTSGGSPSGVTVTGEVRDGSGGGGNDRELEVLMSIEDSLVSLGSVTPAPYRKVTSGGHHQIWWRLTVKNNLFRTLRVKLKCKPGASGPTLVGIAACTRQDPKTPPGEERFAAATHTFYHGHRCSYGKRLAGRAKGR